MKRICETCAAWINGECHLHPPVVQNFREVNDAYLYALIWPKLAADLTCAKWLPKVRGTCADCEFGIEAFSDRTLIDCHHTSRISQKDSIVRHGWFCEKWMPKASD